METAYLRKLWWKIVLTTIAFSVIPLFVLGAVIYYQFSASYTGKITEDLRTLADNRVKALDLFLEERVSQLYTLAHTHPLEKLKNEEYLDNIFKKMRERSQSYIDLGVIDQEGNHLAYVGPYHQVLKGVNYKKEEWFNAVMAATIHVSEVFKGFRQVEHFIITVKVREGNKNWILRATINSDEIERIVRAAQIGKKGDAFLINKQNILQTQPRFSGKLLEKPRAPDFSTVVSTTVDPVTMDGEEFLFAASLLKNQKWILVIREDPGEHLTPLLRARYLALAIGLAGIVLIVIGAVFTTRSMMKELMEMQRKQARSEDMVVQSSKMAALGKMAAGIAHEIDNPLAVIGEKAGWIKDLLRKEDLAQSKNFQEFADSVNKIEYHINRAKKITHRLLSFGRRMEPVSERVDINRVLEETIDFLENEAHYRKIDIQTDLNPDLPQITSDSSQLQQVFLNIINNAIDAIGKNGLIEVKTRYLSETDQVAIVITDNGPGIPKEHIDKIFEPFFTTKEVGRGTGLGLSISSSLVEKLGGRMILASGVGKGSTFTIYFPAK